MFRKVMQTGDELMYRYYELLTDCSLAEIASMKTSMHPMEAKIALAKRIVTDFHSAEDADRAAEVFSAWCAARKFRRRCRPCRCPTASRLRTASAWTNCWRNRPRRFGDRCGTQDQGSAVEINGEKVSELVSRRAAGELVIKVGKAWLKVTPA